MIGYRIGDGFFQLGDFFIELFEQRELILLQPVGRLLADDIRHRRIVGGKD